MKRFWKEATIDAQEEGWNILLDGRPVMTPGRAPLCLPSEPLALAIADEWDSAGDEVDPRAMPLTGLANAAIDRIAADHEGFAGGLSRYGESDLFCYRADHPEALVRRQSEEWEPLLQWARRRYDIDFEVTGGIAHVEQPEETRKRLAHEVAALDAFRLAGLSPLVTIGGSLVAALAVAEGALEPEAAWSAVSLDDRWQAERWGEDAEAAAALANRRKDFLSAARFLALLD